MDSLSYLLPASSLPVLQGFLWFRLDYTSKITLPLAEYFLPMISLANTAVWCLLHLNEMLVLLTMLLQGLWNQNVGRKAGVSQRRARGKWIHSSWRRVHNKHWSFAVADASSIELSKINEDTLLLWQLKSKAITILKYLPRKKKIKKKIYLLAFWSVAQQGFTLHFIVLIYIYKSSMGKVSYYPWLRVSTNVLLLENTSNRFFFFSFLHTPLAPQAWRIKINIIPLT